MEITGPRVDVEALDYEQGWVTYEGILFTGVAFELWPGASRRW